MSKSCVLGTVVGVLALLLCGAGALAGTVGYGDHVANSYFTGDGDANPLTFSGSRTTTNPAEMLGANAWATGFTVDFLVTDLGTGAYRYKYTFTGFTGSDVSHFTLDWSDDLSDLAIRTLAGFDMVSPTGKMEFGDKDGITGAVKFDYGGSAGITYEFDIKRQAMWGDLWVKDGGGNAAGAVNARNTGYDDHVAFTNSDNYIPVPNSTSTTNIVPLPNGVWAGLAFLGVLAAARRFRMRRAVA